MVKNNNTKQTNNKYRTQTNKQKVFTQHKKANIYTIQDNHV